MPEMFLNYIQLKSANVKGHQTHFIILMKDTLCAGVTSAYAYLPLQRHCPHRGGL